ncbi:hypothetical protein FH972_026290 [Carpinus fangiana]|uniref:Shugoshin C-terminal domain-containing protein n=1 Tax=Carpinus fangiana TaxID=176857 RepID=A0A5N6L3P8_9ROSI|nr:hypothetical protein FH972_026290 [Carpinus fangiana]
MSRLRQQSLLRAVRLPCNHHATPTDKTNAIVKRRFVRQNRDLARHNSQQSLKIRMLESELARLRAENVIICEENIQLHTQLDDLQQGSTNPPSSENVAEQEAIRQELEDKVKELNAIAGRLGDANRRSGAGGERKRRRKSEILAASNVERLSPEERRLRRVIERGEAEIMQPPADLPAIFEGKTYPRRTLEMTEMQRLLVDANNSDSPDIGPPPTTFFDREQPAEEREELSSVTLGRRRRSNASRQSDLNSASEAEVGAETTTSAKAFTSDPEAEQLLRVGAKRKWDSRDQKTGAGRRTSGASDEFSFSKRIEPELAESIALKPGTALRIDNGKTSGRRALGSKPVNTDPMVSPRKVALDATKEKPAKPVRSAASAEKMAPASRSAPKARSVRIPKEISVLTDELQGDAVNTVEIKLEPKTPGLVLDDIFSPPDSRQQNEDSTFRPDTPPPTTTSAGGIEGPTGIRGSRRARSQVSYAEPSLNSKMRRAGEKMDAVAGANRHSLAGEERSRSASVQLEEASAQKGTTSANTVRTVTLKRGRAESATNEQPDQGIPLSERLNALVQTDPDTASADSTITSRRRRSEQPSGLSKQSSLRTLEATDVFDVADSPSSSLSGIAVPLPPVQTLKSSASTSTLSRPTNRRQTLAGNVAASAARPGSSGSDKAMPTSKRDGPASRASSASLAKSAVAAAPPSRAAEGVSRADRIAARRRSMML